jgi:hypothetical protein
MARSETTHVLEIESGIGEPAFIPLALGLELSPISVGRKGMWRIESARVLDVHAFVYFDGGALFLQSADERTPVVVEGHAVGQEWTEVRAPCRIEIGQARLRFRSLFPEHDEGEHAATHSRDRAGHAPPVDGVHGALPARPERPFRPGEFAAPQGESTRIAPRGEMELKSSVRPAIEGGRGSYPPPSSAPQRTNDAYPAMGAGAGGPPQGAMPGTPAPYGTILGHDGHPVPSASHPLMASPSAQGVYAPPGGPYAEAMYAPHASHPSHPSYPSHPPSDPRNVYGSMPPQAPPSMAATKDFATTWKEMPGPRRLLILLSPVFLMSAWLLLSDAPPPARAPRGSGSATATARAPTPTAQAPPVAQGVPTAQAPPVAQSVPTAQAPPVQAPVQAPVDPGAKTYERLAVDAYLAGDYDMSARVYAQLGEQTPPPGNIVYLEAARIIRAKLDAGAPR